MRNKIRMLILVVIINLGLLSTTVFAAPIITLSNFRNELMNQINNRNTHINILYTGNLQELRDNVVSITKECSNVNDYYSWNIQKFKSSVTYSNNKATFSADAVYADTKEEDEYVNKNVALILQKIGSPIMTRGEIVQAIYDWITSNVKYDTTLTKRSAYDALQGSCVSTGYSLLMCKMLSMDGIESHIIVGTLNGTEHTWNECKIDNNWYFFDTAKGAYSNKEGNFGQSSDNLLKRNFLWKESDFPVATSTYPYVVAKFKETKSSLVVGGELPKTSLNLYDILLVGVGLTIFGILGLVIKKRCK